MKASELRKIALEKQEELFLDNYNKLIHCLDEYIEHTVNCGKTYVTLVSGCWDIRNFYFGNNVFYIDCDTYTKMKQHYKEMGFKVRHTLFGNNIEISW